MRTLRAPNEMHDARLFFSPIFSVVPNINAVGRFIQCIPNVTRQTAVRGQRFTLRPEIGVPIQTYRCRYWRRPASIKRATSHLHVDESGGARDETRPLVGKQCFVFPSVFDILLLLCSV